MLASRFSPVLCVIVLGYFVVMLDTTIVNIALADIGRSLNAGTALLQWIIDAYALTFAALLLGAGAACDSYGARRVYLTGLAIFGVLSAGCALSPNAFILVMARAVQGAGAAAIVPGALALISRTYPEPAARAKALGVWGGAGGVAAAIGPVLGGALVSWASWRAVFWVNIPTVALLYYASMRILPQVPAGKGRFSGWSQIFGVLGLGAITYSLISGGEHGWSVTHTLILAAGAVFLAVFLTVQQRSRNPVLPVDIFALPRFSIPTLVGFTLNFSFFGQLFMLSLFFQHYLGYAPHLAGLALAPQAASAIIASPLGGRLAARYGAHRVLLIGLLTGSAGFGALTQVNAQTPYPFIALLTFTVGFGTALAIPAATSAALGAAPAQYIGVAGAVFNTARQVGSVAGVAVLGAFIASDDFLFGFRIALAIAGAVFMAAALLVLSVRKT